VTVDVGLSVCGVVAMSCQMLVTKKGPELYFELDKVMPLKPH
jgi:hypothetical protein